MTPFRSSFPPTTSNASFFFSPTFAHLRPLTTTTNMITRSHSTHTPSHDEENPSSQEQNRKQAELYHRQTKHHLTRYSRGPRGLDWSNQPNPFLRYAPHSPLLPLSLPSSSATTRDSSPLFPSLFTSSQPLPPSPISHSSLSLLLFHSLSLSAWKSTSYSTWSLRVNPSSGNLHPTEAYLLSPPLQEPNNPSSPFASSPFLAHYAPKDHALELRCSLPTSSFHRICPQDGSFLVAFTSIFWREAWKYGERAFRYCNHDVGHAIAAVAIAAASLGWDSRLLDGLGHEDLRKLLGIAPASDNDAPHAPAPVRGRMPWMELEHPDCALLVFPSDHNLPVDYSTIASEIEKLASLRWSGKPNSLSKEHVCWDVIYETAKAVEKPLTVSPFAVNPFRGSDLLSESLYAAGSTVWEVVRRRRSAVDMDGVHVMGRSTFYQVMLRCLPSGGTGERQGRQMAVPFRVLPWDSEVHCVLFVHRVADLPGGLYFLVRNEDHFEELKRVTRSEFEWAKPDGCPDGLPLYRLALGDCRGLAKTVSCHQDIASDGCFSLGMVARFEPVLRERNAWMYPRLFWETGVLGQVLYLEAHAVGISATGIGCFFDDAVHEVLGLEGSEFQSLYHFTVGSPVLDSRIMSLPAYPGPSLDS